MATLDKARDSVASGDLEAIIPRCADGFRKNHHAGTGELIRLRRDDGISASNNTVFLWLFGFTELNTQSKNKLLGTCDQLLPVLQDGPTIESEKFQG